MVVAMTGDATMNSATANRPFRIIPPKPAEHLAVFVPSAFERNCMDKLFGFSLLQNMAVSGKNSPLLSRPTLRARIDAISHVV
jgi:hypothetical protein